VAGAGGSGKRGRARHRPPKPTAVSADFAVAVPPTPRPGDQHRGQAVSAFNRLHFSSGLPSLLIRGHDDRIIPVAHDNAVLPATSAAVRVYDAAEKRQTLEGQTNTSLRRGDAAAQPAGHSRCAHTRRRLPQEHLPHQLTAAWTVTGLMPASWLRRRRLGRLEVSVIGGFVFVGRVVELAVQAAIVVPAPRDTLVISRRSPRSATDRCGPAPSVGAPAATKQASWPITASTAPHRPLWASTCGWRLRWKVEESFQSGKELGGLDEHPVRRWSSRHTAGSL
jgi:hypothetical protein